MKRIALVLMTALPLLGLGNEPKKFEYSLKGNITKIADPAKKVLVAYVADGKRVVDTIAIENGTFNIKGTFNEPTRLNLRLMVDSAEAVAKGITRRPLMQRDLLTVFVERGNITITAVDSFSNSVVKGSKTHDEYVKLNAMIKPYTDKQAELNKQYPELAKAKDEARIKQLQAEYKVESDKIKQVYKEYILKNSSSTYAPFALTAFAGFDIDPVEVEPLYNALPAAVKEWPSTQAFGKKLDIAKKTAVGNYAMDFAQADTAGNMVKLSSLYGKKYLLVDFWASWCGPCRKENPNVVEAYQKYKDKGFDILGVSLDRPGDKDKWMKAIHDDKLTWTHISDLKYWDSDVVKQYNIGGIPYNLLLDPQGKIVAKNLRGEELHKKLEEILK